MSQHVNDCIELTLWLMKVPELTDSVRHGIFLIGGSWGSMLATYAVQQRPDLYRKVILRGVVSDCPQSEILSNQFIESRMKYYQYSEDTIRTTINAIGKPPYGTHIDILMRQREWLSAMGGMDYASYIYGNEFSSVPVPIPRWWLSHCMSKALFTCQEMSLLDILEFKAHMTRTLVSMWPTVEATIMSDTVKKLDIPVLAVHGVHDNCTAHSLVEGYIGSLEAPEKYIVWFEKSGHSPHKEESLEFSKVVEFFFADEQSERSSQGVKANIIPKYTCKYPLKKLD